MSVMNVESFTTFANEAPLASRIARRFSNTCSVWRDMSPSPTRFPSGSNATCPDTNSSAPSPVSIRTACE
jgi:hypothetical protein